MVFLVVLVRHKVPIRNGRVHSPDMTCVATKIHAVELISTLLSASRGLEYLCVIPDIRQMEQDE